MPSIQRCPVHNRIEAVMTHIKDYWFDGVTRLAADAGVSKSAISRLINGRSSPSFPLAWAVTKALEKQLGKRLDPCELLSVDGTYPTASVCELCGCQGCLPAEIYNAADRVRPEYRHIRSGQWSFTAHTKPSIREVKVQEAP